MKQYFTGFFTGACLVASAVMFMGATKGKIDQYQFNGDVNPRLLDTQTGNLYASITYSPEHPNYPQKYWYRTHGFKD